MWKILPTLNMRYPLRVHEESSTRGLFKLYKKFISDDFIGV